MTLKTGPRAKAITADALRHFYMLRLLPPLAATLLAVSLLAGCAGGIVSQFTQHKAEEINLSLGMLTATLAGQMQDFSMESRVVAVTTFVNLQDLERSSDFGRYCEEQVKLGMHQAGLRVAEIRQANAVMYDAETGEFILTRRFERLAKATRVDALVAGTYAIVGADVVVNAELIDIATGRVISASRQIVQPVTNPVIARLIASDVKHDQSEVTVKK